MEVEGLDVQGFNQKQLASEAAQRQRKEQANQRSKRKEGSGATVNGRWRTRPAEREGFCRTTKGRKQMGQDLCKWPRVQMNLDACLAKSQLSHML